MNVLFMFFSCMLVFRCECMRPKLCIEQNESKYLKEYHESEMNQDSEEDDFYLPRSEQELEAVYEAYQKSKYQSIFFLPIVVNIEEEIEARCKDGQLDAIDRYLQCLDGAFGCFQSFRDSSFANSFFLRFQRDIFLFILDVERLIKDPTNDFTRDSMHFVHVVKELAAMLGRIQCISEEENLFESYERLCLDDEYKNSEGYKRKCAVVLGALADGLSLL